MATSESEPEVAPPSAAAEADAGEAGAPSSEANAPSPASASAPPCASSSVPASAQESTPASQQEPISPQTAHATEVALAEVRLSEVVVSGRQSSSFESIKSRTISRPEGYVPVGKKHKVRVIRGPMEITPEWLTKVFTARKYLKPGGLIFPDKAVLYLSAVEDGDYKAEKMDWWDDVYGFKMSALKELAYVRPRAARAFHAAR